MSDALYGTLFVASVELEKAGADISKQQTALRHIFYRCTKLRLKREAKKAETVSSLAKYEAMIAAERKTWSEALIAVSNEYVTAGTDEVKRQTALRKAVDIGWFYLPGTVFEGMRFNRGMSNDIIMSRDRCKFSERVFHNHLVYRLRRKSEAFRLLDDKHGKDVRDRYPVTVRVTG